MSASVSALPLEAAAAVAVIGAGAMGGSGIAQAAAAGGIAFISSKLNPVWPNVLRWLPAKHSPQPQFKHELSTWRQYE